MLKELGAALRATGYDTSKKIKQLIDEAKLEVTEEWLVKRGVSQGSGRGSSGAHATPH